MLNDRARALLKTLVERYIEEGQPLGSRALSRLSGLDLSPASIRNVMADLEELGFIASPHTSAGRVPTALGYRIFVDSLLTIKPLSAETLNQLEQQLLPADTTRLVAAASQMLSELTTYAGIVRTPRHRSSGFRHVEFLQLSTTRILLILVTLDGDVQNRVLCTQQSFSNSQLAQASSYLNEHFSGVELEEIQHALHKELCHLSAHIQSLMSAAVEAGRSALSDRQDGYVVSGERHLITHQDHTSDLASIRKLFEAFEQKTELLQLLDLSRQAEGVKIFIGGESGLDILDEFSMVTAPYEVNGQVVGTLGVVGPTRMAYERVIPIVDVTARLLSSALSQP